MISAPHEYYSSRTTKKDGKTSFVDQIMKDTETTHYLKRKFATIQQSQEWNMLCHVMSYLSCMSCMMWYLIMCLACDVDLRT